MPLPYRLQKVISPLPSTCPLENAPSWDGLSMPLFHLEKGLFPLRHQGVNQIAPAQCFIGFHAPFQIAAFFQQGLCSLWSKQAHICNRNDPSFHLRCRSPSAHSNRISGWSSGASPRSCAACSLRGRSVCLFQHGGRGCVRFHVHLQGGG